MISQQLKQPQAQPLPQPSVRASMNVPSTISPAYSEWEWYFFAGKRQISFSVSMESIAPGFTKFPTWIAQGFGEQKLQLMWSHSEQMRAWRGSFHTVLGFRSGCKSMRCGLQSEKVHRNHIIILLQYKDNATATWYCSIKSKSSWAGEKRLTLTLILLYLHSHIIHTLTQWRSHQKIQKWKCRSVSAMISLKLT